MRSFNINSIIDPAFLELGKEIRLKQGQILTQQFAKSKDFYLLKSGSVTFSLALDESLGEIQVGESNERFTPIGWSGFNPPGRYATTVKVGSLSASFYKWSHDDLKELFISQPEKGTQFLKVICYQARNLIKIAIEQLSGQGPELPQSKTGPNDNFTLVEKSNSEELFQFLRKSAFFEVFEEAPLEFISQNLVARSYQPNELIYSQDKPSDGLYLLESGKVRFSYQGKDHLNASFRQITTPGFVVGWAGVVDAPNIINAHAVSESVIYYISSDNLDRVLKLNPTFAPRFFRRLLWLIGYQLQAIRARMIASHFDHEVMAISNLIDQNSAKLDLNSQLHKIPHLLENKLTVQDAFDILDQLKDKGTSLEKNIATVVIDIIEEIKKEHDFYHGLVNVYKSVIDAPTTLRTADIRKLNARKYAEVWKDQQYVISGQDNLPDEPGNIFIYNHLRNHPYNTLPNQFQITLDSHFVSAMLLMEKYGDPGLRIVRLGMSMEFAHQEYYQRLGHLNVFTEESEKKSKKTKKKVRQMFFNEAGAYLKRGGNLIISPEGNSYSTEESPGPFKPGAFNLAMSMKKEPYIVPIALAHFDRRVRSNRFSCLIMPPFKVSDYLSHPVEKGHMKQFLTEYRKTYRSYIEKAIALAGKS